MRGPLTAALLLLGPVSVLGAVTLQSTQVASSEIKLSSDEASESLTFRFDVYGSEDPCGHPNVAIGGEPLQESGKGGINLGSGVRARGQWKAICADNEQLLIVSLESIPTKGFQGVEFSVRFRQVAPVYISAVEQSVALIPTGDDEPFSKEGLMDELEDDFDELLFLHDTESELLREIELKENFLRWMEMNEKVAQLADGEGDVASKVRDAECRGLWCFLRGAFDKVTGLVHPGRGHRGRCGHHPGNHTHGNHSFPHPPWWKHPHGNHTHGNHTHGNHTFPHPPWWRPHRPHGNHTHGNHTHPPFHRLPPFFCRPHGRPPHRRPPHHKPPHHKVPHGRPPLDRPHGLPQRPFRPGWPAPGHGPAVHIKQGSLSFFHTLSPLFKLGLIAALFSLVAISLHARCRARRGYPSWEERREARRRACRAKRAALRRRWIAFLDRLRPEDFDEEAARVGMLEEGIVTVEEKSFAVLEEGEVVSEKEKVVEERTTISQELASFRDAAYMVEEMVAAEKEREKAKGV